MDFHEKSTSPSLPINGKSGTVTRIEKRSSTLPSMRKLLAGLLILGVGTQLAKVAISHPKPRRPFGKAAEKEFL